MRRLENCYPGETIFMRDFADTLTYLAETGPREFYEGDCSTVSQRLSRLWWLFDVEDLKITRL
jgi:gamma-glutamyltranspeptidase